MDTSPTRSTEVREDQPSSEQKGDALPVPEEAVERFIRRLDHNFDSRGGTYKKERWLEIKKALEAAAPALRKQGADQERQRLKEALEDVASDLRIAAGAEAEKCESEKEPTAEAVSDAFTEAANRVERVHAALEADHG